MDTRFLESFVIVAELGSIAEAAHRLNLTPAAVAQRIKALEQEIGCSLVLRTGRTVKPTPSGLAILPRARLLVRDARDLRSIAADDLLAGAGELRLGATASALTGVLPNVIANLTSRYPRIELFVRPGSSVELYPLVVSGELDAAILVRPEFATPKSCGWHTLREEPLILIAPAAMTIDEADAVIEREPFIRYDRNHWGGRIVDRYLRSKQLKVRERFEMDALDAIAALVNRALGVAVVPDWAPPWLERLDLQKVPLDGFTERREVGVLWNQASPRIAFVRTFLRACTEEHPG